MHATKTIFRRARILGDYRTRKYTWTIHFFLDQIFQLFKKIARKNKNSHKDHSIHTPLSSILKGKNYDKLYDTNLLGILYIRILII